MAAQISASRGRSTRRWRKIRAATLAESTNCMVCGHAGADTGGHKQSRKTHPELAEVKSNVGPIHGIDGCPTCSRKCNNEQGARSLEDMVQLNTSRDWFAA